MAVMLELAGLGLADRVGGVTAARVWLVKIVTPLGCPD